MKVINDFESMFSIPIERIPCLYNDDICIKNNIKIIPSLILYDGDTIINNISGFFNSENMISLVKSSLLDLNLYKINLDKNDNENIITKKKIISYINPLCPFCKKLDTVLDEAKEKYSNYFLFEYIDCSNNIIMCKNIQGVPSINIMENNNIIDQQIGFIPFDNFKQKLEKHFKKYTISIIINQYCNFSKKMIEHFNSFKEEYSDVFDYEIVDNTFDDNFRLDLFIDTYPSIYLHDKENIIRKTIGYLEKDEFKKWLLFE